MQSEDQFGFRPSRSNTHALLALESVVSKGIEWSTPILIVSVDLRKAFDRVEQRALMKALRDQGVDAGYILLRELLYRHQVGLVVDLCFPIDRGVRQGDVLSPLLFNALLEQALKQWKSEPSNEGFALTARTGDPRHTHSLCR